MLIKVKTNRDFEQDFLQLSIQLLDPPAVEAFKQLVDRALNCWPEAPPELKELGDMLTHGRVTQDHHSQMYSRKDYR